MTTKNCTKQIILAIVACFSFVLKCKAQVVPIDIIQRCYKADFIFEGKVIRTTSYWNLSHKFIYTSNTIQIYKIFKGDITCGTIEIVTLGGCLRDTCLDISENITLKKEMLGIFMCKATTRELSAIDFYPESNPAKLEVKFGDEGFVKYFDDSANSVVSDWEFQLDSLAQVYDLLNLYAQLNYVNCAKGLSIIHGHKELTETKPVVPHNPHKNFLPSTKLKVEGVYRQAGVDTSIYYDIINPHIVESYPLRKFEFDVALSDQISDAYLWTAAFLIEYDTAIFGENVWLNGHEEITAAGISALPSYGDPSFYAEDLPGFNNILAFQLYPSGSGMLYELTGSPQVAAHVSLTMNTCDITGNIYLDDPETYAPARFDTSQDGSSLPFYYNNAVLQTNAMTVPKCDMHITSINPLQVNGGVKDTVTITGFNFKDAKGNGEIFIKDAQQGGQYYLKLEYMDIHSWSDTMIVFEMPSYIDSLNTLALNNHFGVPGSGALKLFNDLGDSAIGDNIGVFYSIANTKDHPNLLTHKYFNNLVDYDTSSTGGYIFHPDTSVFNHDSLMMCLTTAMHNWNCQTHVNFQIGDSIIDTGVAGEFDGLNIVSVGALDTGVIAQTFVHSFASVCERAYVKEIDIVINSLYLPVLWCDTSACDTVPVGKKDLYAALLHEIGHAHSLSHINDSTKMMWYMARRPNASGTVLPWDRPIYLYLDAPADSGGARVMSASADAFLHDSCYRFIMSPYTPSDCAAHTPPHEGGNHTEALQSIGCWPHPYVEEITKPDIQLIAFPNPANAEINFQYQTEDFSDIHFTISDYIGKEIFKSENKKEQKGIHKIKYDTHNLSVGLYLINLKVNDYQYFFKFVKE